VKASTLPERCDLKNCLTSARGFRLEEPSICQKPGLEGTAMRDQGSDCDPPHMHNAARRREWLREAEAAIPAPAVERGIR